MRGDRCNRQTGLTQAFRNWRDSACEERRRHADERRQKLIADARSRRSKNVKSDDADGLLANGARSDLLACRRCAATGPGACVPTFRLVVRSLFQFFNWAMVVSVLRAMRAQRVAAA